MYYNIWWLFWNQNIKQCAAKGFFELSCLPTTYVRLTITFEQKKLKVLCLAMLASTKLRVTYLHTSKLDKVLVLYVIYFMHAGF